MRITVAAAVQISRHARAPRGRAFLRRARARGALRSTERRRRDV